jgi:hypothetical protein
VVKYTTTSGARRRCPLGVDQHGRAGALVARAHRRDHQRLAGREGAGVEQGLLGVLQARPGDRVAVAAGGDRQPEHGLGVLDALAGELEHVAAANAWQAAGAEVGRVVDEQQLRLAGGLAAGTR